MDINKMFAELAKNRMILAEAKREVERLENEIKSLMDASGEYEILGEEHKATWTSYEKSQFDLSKFKAEHPKIVERYTVTKEQKRFTFA